MKKFHNALRIAFSFPVVVVALATAFALRGEFVESLLAVAIFFLHEISTQVKALSRLTEAQLLEQQALVDILDDALIVPVSQED